MNLTSVNLRKDDITLGKILKHVCASVGNVIGALSWHLQPVF